MLKLIPPVRRSNMNSLASRLLILLIAFQMFAYQTAAAQTPVSVDISGYVLPSGGKEGDTVGTFSIAGSGDGKGRGGGLFGEFSGSASLTAVGPGLGSNNEISFEDVSITGSFDVDAKNARIYFSGETSQGQSFKGQMRRDMHSVAFFEEGKYTGFFEIRGNGYMNVIAIRGEGCIPCP